jgi:biuret amidohydrolase
MIEKKSALLIIDIQKDNVAEDGPFPFDPTEVSQLIDRVNLETACYEENEFPVYFIRQIYSNIPAQLFSKLLLKGITLAGRPGAELDDRLSLRHGNIFDKPSQNAFKKTDLNTELSSQDIQHLHIMGLDGAYCVAATADGALDLGYDVILHEDSIITNQPKKWNKLKGMLYDKGARKA